MLETIRTAAKTWVAKVILALITVPFALWGVESYIRSAPGQDAIATVGEEKISAQEFNDAVRNQLDQFRQQFGGSIDAAIMDSPEMRKSVLDQLIDQRLLTSAMQAGGLAVSDAALRDRISNEPSFQEAGKFSSARYDVFLKSQGYTPARFEGLLRKDMERQQFVESIAKTAFSGSVSAQQYLLASEQSREIAVAAIAPDSFVAAVKLTPEQTKNYYESHQTEFTIPAQVKAEYIELSIDVLAPQIQLTAEEIKAYYDANAARYVQKEERKASHILIAVAATAKDEEKKAAKDKADALFAQVKKNPKEFADLAKKNSQDPGSAPAGGDLGFFGRGAMVPPFEQAVFKASKDEIIGPVKSDFGYHIIRLTDIRPEKAKSLADATPEIEGELKKQKAQKKFAELAEKFSNLAYEQSTSLKAAADAVNLPIKQSPFITKGVAIQPPFNNPKLMTALFSDDVLKNKRNTEAVEIATNSLVVARALESKPAVLRPFAEVEPAITVRLTREEAGKLAKKDGEAKLALLREGKPTDIKFPALLAVSRTNLGGLPQDVIEAALRAETKTLPAYVGVENPNGGYLLVQVAKVIPPAVSDEAKLKATGMRLTQSQAQQQLQSMVASMRTKVDVSIKKDALEKKADR